MAICESDVANERNNHVTRSAAKKVFEPRNDRVIRDADFASRLARSCDLHVECPPLHRGRLVWIQQKLETDFNQRVSIETVRKWLSGEAKPRPDKIKLLAALLGVDLAWLQIDVGAAPVSGEEVSKYQALSTHPLFGALKGTFTIADGVDLTEPADPEWADLAEKKAREWQS